MDNLTDKQFGPYQLESLLGEGGMATVYKAYQAGIERHVALKILPRHFASDPKFVARFQQEAKVLARLQHPHILPIHDYGEAEGYLYIVMPLIESGSLTDLLTEEPLPLPQIGRIISQVGDALDYAHTHGIIHRDVKPSNILLDERGNSMLTDFGIAKILEGFTTIKGTERLTGSGDVIGTPAYMSPEQGSGNPFDGRSDIYSLGVILYKLTTGRVPFKGNTPVAVVVQHMLNPPPPPRQLNPDLPIAVEQVMLKALAKQPADRYGTAGEMVEALQQALEVSGWRTASSSISLKELLAHSKIVAGGINEVSYPNEYPTKLSVKVEESLAHGVGWRNPILGVFGAIILLLLLLMARWCGQTTLPAENKPTATVPLVVVPTPTVTMSPTMTLTPMPMPTLTPMPTPTIEILKTSTVFTPTSTPAPVPTGLSHLTLWTGSTAGTLGAGREKWFIFNSGKEVRATIMAFIKNSDKIDLVVYHSRVIPTWPPPNPHDVPNVGRGSPRDIDRNDQTYDLIWEGAAIEPNTDFYVRLFNRSDRAVAYCIITRSDKNSCP